MKVNLENLANTFQSSEILYLSTSVNDVVSARPVSPLNIGMKLYIRTSASSRKAKEMNANPNIAACIGHYYLTGEAYSLGSVLDEKNAGIKDAYAKRYPGAFSGEDTFIQPDELFFEISVKKAAEWIYENGVPVGFAEQQM